MTDFKAEVADLKDKATELEGRADGLRNKHLRDLFRAAIGRLEDALGHPDMDLLADEERRKEVEHADEEHRKEVARAAEAAQAEEARRKEAEHEHDPHNEPFPGVIDHATEERQEPQNHLG